MRLMRRLVSDLMFSAENERAKQLAAQKDQSIESMALKNFDYLMQVKGATFTINSGDNLQVIVGRKRKDTNEDLLKVINDLAEDKNYSPPPNISESSENLHNLRLEIEHFKQIQEQHLRRKNLDSKFNNHDRNKDMLANVDAVPKNIIIKAFSKVSTGGNIDFKSVQAALADLPLDMDGEQLKVLFDQISNEKTTIDVDQFINLVHQLYHQNLKLRKNKLKELLSEMHSEAKDQSHMEDVSEGNRMSLHYTWNCKNNRLKVLDDNNKEIFVKVPGCEEFQKRAHSICTLLDVDELPILIVKKKDDEYVFPHISTHYQKLSEPHEEMGFDLGFLCLSDIQNSAYLLPGLGSFLESRAKNKFDNFLTKAKKKGAVDMTSQLSEDQLNNLKELIVNYFKNGMTDVQKTAFFETLQQSGLSYSPFNVNQIYLLRHYLLETPGQLMKKSPSIVDALFSLLFLLPETPTLDAIKKFYYQRQN